LRFIPSHTSRGRKPTAIQKARQHNSMLGHAVSADTRAKISAHHRANGIMPSYDAIVKSNLNRRRRDNSPSWKGGISTVNGYRCVYDPEHPRHHPNGYVYEHIVLAEQKLARPLLPHEVVHHIDGDKANNTLENLVVLGSQGDHIKLHQRAKMPRSS
jgi:hypothetical protein